MATAVEQCQTGYQALQTFFNNLGTFYSSGGTPPDPSSLYAGLNFEELLTFTSKNNMNSADFALGASIETVNHFVGVERELSMAEVGKNAIYISAISEHTQESAFYGQNASFFSGVIGGAPTTGSQC